MALAQGYPSSLVPEAVASPAGAKGIDALADEQADFLGRLYQGVEFRNVGLIIRHGGSRAVQIQPYICRAPAGTPFEWNGSSTLLDLFKHMAWCNSRTIQEFAKTYRATQKREARARLRKRLHTAMAREEAKTARRVMVEKQKRRRIAWNRFLDRAIPQFSTVPDWFGEIIERPAPVASSDWIE